MTLITFVLSAIGVLLNPAGGGTAAPAGIVGPIGKVVATATPAPAPMPAPTPQDIVGPIGE
jgi:hypothetical protein